MNDKGRRRGAGVRVGKSDTAVSRAIDDVSPVAPAAGTTAITAVFIHAGDVHVSCNEIASDLNVSNEDGPSGNREVHGPTPSGTVISRADDRDGGPRISEVVIGDVHSPEKWRGWVVVAPARLAVAIARRKVGNAWANRPGDAAVSGLPGTDALSAAAGSEKNCKESAGRFVVESNRVAKVCPVAGTKRIRVEPGESGAAIAGVRCAGIVAGAVRESL